jgi:hypothetical protein
VRGRAGNSVAPAPASQQQEASEKDKELKGEIHSIDPKFAS